MKQIPDFKSEPERREWLTNNADYFTIIRRYKRSYERWERPTLDEAKATAKTIVAKINTPVMIYAVVGSSDSWVTTIKPKVKVAKKEGKTNARRRTREHL